MRKLCTFVFPFAGAALAAVYLLPGEFLLPAALVCALGTALCLLFRGDWRLRAALIALGLAAGFLWSWGYDALAVAPARVLAGQTVSTSATVDAYPREANGRWSVTVRLEDAPWFKTVLYTDADCSAVRPGDTLDFTAKLRLADTLDGEESTYYFSHGVCLLASCDGETETRRAEQMPLWYWPAAWAEALRQTARELWPEDEAAVIIGLLTGDRSDLDSAYYAALKRCGLAHVIVVSGMHLTFLVGLVQVLTGKKNRRKLALWGIPAVLLFMAMTGFPASIVRAGVMELCLLAAPALGREEDGPTALAASLLLLLAVNPNSAADVGLQLSFASVVGIQVFSGRLDGWLTARLGLERDRGDPFLRRAGKALGRLVSGSLSTTLGAIAFTTPLVAYYFGYVSLISPLANLLCLWAVSYAFAFGALAAALGCLWLPLGGLFAAAASLPAKYLLWLPPLLAKLPYAAVPVKDVYLWLWLGFVYVLLALWLLVRQGRKNPLVPIAAGAAMLALALVLTGLTFTAGDMTATVLDVGQGLCVVLHSAGHTIVVDCGGSGADNAGDRAADYIQSLGSSRIDLLVLTHYHTDHANGVEELMKRVEVGMLALPDVEEDAPLRAKILSLAAERGVEAWLLEDDAQVTFGEASMKLYAPLGAGSTNEAGLTALASCGDFDLLITGDMGTAVEKRLVKYGALPDVEVLVVGHHGSKYATGEELLLAAKPEHAVISVGYNTYGHPAAETLERLAAAGCHIYRTDWAGNVTFTVEKGAS